jgi:hypothetical protein
LLAVAIFGIIMVKVFSGTLNRSLAGQSLPPDVLGYLRANEIKLAGLDLPAGLGRGPEERIRSLVSEAFVVGFRVVMVICAGLSVASAVVARVMIPAKSD